MTTLVSTAEKLIDVQAVSRVFPKANGDDLLVLEKVDLTIRSGEIVGLLGRSGSGKSTLLRIIAGLSSPSSGVALYRGEPISGPPRGLAMVFQSFGAVSLAHRAAERRARPRGAGHRRRRAAQPRPGGHRPDRPRRLRKRLSQGTLRRHAPARRLCPGAGGPPRHHADGQSPSRRSTCADGGNAAHRHHRPVDRGPAADEIGADRHPQHRGGGADVRPHSRLLLQPRPHRLGNQGRPCRTRATASTPPSASWSTASTPT